MSAYHINHMDPAYFYKKRNYSLENLSLKQHKILSYITYNHLVMDQGALLRVQSVLVLNTNGNLRHAHNIKRD